MCAEPRGRFAYLNIFAENWTSAQYWSNVRFVMTNSLDRDVLAVLRALFELAEVDMPASSALVAALLGFEDAQCSAYIAQLRTRRLIQRDRVGLTMVGLALALALPPIEPVSMKRPTVIELRTAA